ncbi:MAG: hypothetical protein WAL25_09440 [Acidimicrobiia bacterium]
MTVLQRNDARGVSSGRAKSYVIGVALAVVGVGAAFGLSRVIDTDVEYTGAMAERGAAAQGNLDAIRQGANAQAAALSTTGWALEDELAALHARQGASSGDATRVEPALQRGEAMQDNLDAVRRGARAQSAVLAEPDPGTQFQRR